MKVRIIQTLILLLFFNSFGQPKEEINLPEGGKDIEIKETTLLYGLYITKNQEVYNDDKRLAYFQDINYSFYKQFYKSVSTGTRIPIVLLYADRNTPYKFISRIKQHIPNLRWIFHMTENIEGFKATAFRNYAPAKNLILEEIYTLDQEFIEFDTPITNAWYQDFEETLYYGNKEAIKKALMTYKYNVVNILPNKVLKHRNTVVNNKYLKKIISSNTVLFLKFNDKTLYEDYVFAVQKIKKHQINFEEKNKKKAYVVEISFQLEKILNKLDIELND